MNGSFKPIVSIYNFCDKVSLVPHVRHPTPAQRMAGLDFSLFYAFECPVSGKRAATPRREPKTARRVVADFAASATGGKVRRAAVPADCSERLLRAQSGRSN